MHQRVLIFVILVGATPRAHAGIRYFGSRLTPPPAPAPANTTTIEPADSSEARPLLVTEEPASEPRPGQDQFVAELGAGTPVEAAALTASLEAQYTVAVRTAPRLRVRAEGDAVTSSERETTFELGASLAPTYHPGDEPRIALRFELVGGVERVSDVVGMGEATMAGFAGLDANVKLAVANQRVELEAQAGPRLRDGSSGYAATASVGLDLSAVTKDLSVSGSIENDAAGWSDDAVEVEVEAEYERGWFHGKLSVGSPVSDAALQVGAAMVYEHTWERK